MSHDPIENTIASRSGLSLHRQFLLKMMDLLRETNSLESLE